MTREPCTEGTREEILKDIIAWANAISADSPPVFWLTGQAGSGKTTIAYTIAQYFHKLEKKEHTGRRTVLAGTFFCSRQFEETRRQIRIIPTLAYQLARKSRSYAHALHELDKFDSADKLAEQMEDLFVGPWQKSNPNVIRNSHHTSSSLMRWTRSRVQVSSRHTQDNQPTSPTRTQVSCHKPARPSSRRTLQVLLVQRCLSPARCAN